MCRLTRMLEPRCTDGPQITGFAFLGLRAAVAAASRRGSLSAAHMHTQVELTCSFFCSFFFHPHPTTLPPFFFLSLSLSVFSFMSTITNTPCEDEDLVDLNESDSDLPNLDASASLVSSKPASHPPSLNVSASSFSLATPSSSSLSLPSGLPVTTISRLTHDELRVNAEFMKYVNMVDVLLNIWEKSPSNGEYLPPPPFFFLTILILFYSLPRRQLGWVVPSPKRLGLSGLLWRRQHVASSPPCPSLLRPSFLLSTSRPLGV